MNDPAAQSKSILPAPEDPDVLLKLMDVQIALRRAQRLSGAADRRRGARVLGVVFILFIALGAMGALFYLKTTRYAGLNRPRASPAPAASSSPGR